MSGKTKEKTPKGTEGKGGKGPKDAGDQKGRGGKRLLRSDSVQSTASESSAATPSSSQQSSQNVDDFFNLLVESAPTVPRSQIPPVKVQLPMPTIKPSSTTGQVLAPVIAAPTAPVQQPGQVEPMSVTPSRASTAPATVQVTPTQNVQNDVQMAVSTNGTPGSNKKKNKKKKEPKEEVRFYIKTFLIRCVWISGRVLRVQYLTHIKNESRAPIPRLDENGHSLRPKIMLGPRELLYQLKK